VRAIYQQRITALDLRRVKFVDESGMNLAMIRVYGRAPTGERVIGSVPQNYGQNATMPGALGVQVLHAVMTVDGATDVVDAELATTAENRTRGLMERASLPADRGMLFLFETAQPLSFWMFNTLIPLDIIFANAQRRITTIHAAVPPCRPPEPCPSYVSDGVAQFVLEVNAGTAAKAGIAVGDELHWSLP
jgi:uncharacterized membrane protein (UPF0127 family)